MAIRLTLEGKKFLLLTLLIAVAAINTANNLMYLVLAMMLSMLAVSYAALRLNLTGLALRVQPGRAFYAKRWASLHFSASNGKRRSGTYSLSVALPEGFNSEGSVPYVPAGGEAQAVAEVFFNKRGVYRDFSVSVRSGFPFIFFTGARRVKAEGEVLVYPEILDVDHLVEAASSRAGEGHAVKPGRGEDLLGIRELRHGDDMRMVSWKATARAEKLMVREFAEDTPRAFTVALDDRGPSHAALFERAVSVAASVSKGLIDDGYFVKLVTCGKVLPMGAGPEHLHRVLELLAMAREGEREKCVMEDELIGLSVLVLKSAESELRGSAHMFDTVIYAADV